MTTWMDWACLGEASAGPKAMALQACEIAQAMKHCVAWVASSTGVAEADVFLTSSATAACDVLLRLPFRNGARIILTTNHVFRSIADAVHSARELRQAQEQQIRHHTVSIDALLCLSPDALALALANQVTHLTANAPSVLILEHVTSSLGLKLPVEVVADSLRPRNCDLIVDTAQSAGLWPCRSATFGQFGCFHKYLNCPAGTGFGTVGAELHGLLPASTVTLAKLVEAPGGMATQGGEQWIGCSKRLEDNQASRFAAKRIYALRTLLEKHLAEFVLPAIAATNPDYRSHIVALDVGDAIRAQRLWRALEMSGFITKREGSMLRLSLHHTLTATQISAFAEAFCRELRRV